MTDADACTDCGAAMHAPLCGLCTMRRLRSENEALRKRAAAWKACAKSERREAILASVSLHEVLNRARR